MHEEGRLKVLYVDDEEGARKYFASLFGNEFDVDVADSYDSAVALLDAGRLPDVLVTDFRMPGRHGGDLLCEVQARLPNVICMIVTAYADKPMLMETINSADVFRLIEKPMEPRFMRAHLRQAVAAARQRKLNHHRLMAMDEGLSFLAHELNTPLLGAVASARGIVQRMTDGMLRSEDHEAVLHAAARVEHGASYCMSVLASFIDSVRTAGVESSRRMSMPASTIVTSLLDTYPLTPAQRAGVNVDVVDDFHVEASPMCASLVLSSLLGNALRVLDGRADMRIGFRIEREGGQRIVVSDNGPGFAPHVMERLFVDSVSTRADAGDKGMGMIFCRRIMQSFFGGIDVASDTGSGTQITLHFPVQGIPSGAIHG